jgi:hypothetical protein
VSNPERPIDLRLAPLPSAHSPEESDRVRRAVARVFDVDEAQAATLAQKEWVGDAG